MKTPSYEPGAGALAAFLNSVTQAHRPELFTIILAGGSVLRYTNFDRPIAVPDGRTFAVGPVISRSRVSERVGIEVSTLRMTISADDALTINGVPMLRAIGQGLLDGATVLLERAYLDDTLALRGVLPIFGGREAGLTCTRSQAEIEVSSWASLLNVKIPAGVYQPSCRNTLFDGLCGVTKASRVISRTAAVGTGPARNTFQANFAATLAATAGYLNLGRVSFTSGRNAGVSRTIKQHTALGGNGLIETIAPWPFQVDPGDAFDVWPGCDKTKATCESKYSNVIRFRAEPFIPVPETVM